MVKQIDPAKFIFNKQWITKNPSFDQSWAKGTGRLPYERNEVRLTIEIPLKEMINCKPWSQMKFLTPEVAEFLSCMGDPENWHIFSGRIKPAWIITIDENIKSEEIKNENSVCNSIQK